MSGRTLIARAKEHLRESEIRHLDEVIDDLEEQLRRARARRAQLWQEANDAWK